MSVNFERSPLSGPSLLAVPRLRLGDADERASRYVDTKIVDWFIQEVYDPIISLGTSRGLSQRYLDAIHVVKAGYLNVQLLADEVLTPSGLDLWTMLEEGWGFGGYDINAKNPSEQWLVWTGGKYGPGYHSAPHVFHPGFRGYHLFDSVKNWGFVDRFLDKVAYETEQYMEKVKFR